jgi:hypothetical protein
MVHIFSLVSFENTNAYELNSLTMTVTIRENLINEEGGKAVARALIALTSIATLDLRYGKALNDENV